MKEFQKILHGSCTEKRNDMINLDLENYSCFNVENRLNKNELIQRYQLGTVKIREVISF